MKRVVIRTETREADGSFASSERVEESENSGLLEAWGFLILILFTLLIFFLTYRFVSNIAQRESNNGIQERQNQNYQSPSN